MTILTPQQSKERELQGEAHRVQIREQIQSRERRMQIWGLLVIALLVLLFTLWRAGWHAVVPRGWWG